jgi:hypothetical protein
MGAVCSIRNVGTIIHKQVHAVLTVRRLKPCVATPVCKQLWGSSQMTPLPCQVLAFRVATFTHTAQIYRDGSLCFHNGTLGQARFEKVSFQNIRKRWFTGLSVLLNGLLQLCTVPAKVCWNWDVLVTENSHTHNRISHFFWNVRENLSSEQILPNK